MQKFYFERQQEARGEIPTTFTYDLFPQELKTQMILIWERQRGIDFQLEKIVPDLRLALSTKYLFDLESLDYEWDYSLEITTFFLQSKNIDHILTIVEIFGSLIEPYLLKEMNYRLQRAGVGYKHTGKELLRVEDDIFFNEVTLLCLSILSQNGFETARRHYINAYDELKQQKYDDALTDCRQSLESIIKTRLKNENIPYSETENLNKILPIVKSHIIAPMFLEEYLNNLFKLFEGQATWANKEGAHGKADGSTDQVDDTFVRYVINQTAANILFFAEAKFSKEKRR